MPYDSEFRSVKSRLNRLEILLVLSIVLSAGILLKILGLLP